MATPGQRSRALIKLSGEALMGEAGYGVDPATVSAFARDIVGLANDGVDIAIVVGGGNIFRGVAGAASGMDRVTADHIGMLATVMNGLSLSSALEQAGGAVRLMSAIPMSDVCPDYTVHDARVALEAGKIVVAAGGTGSPFFTTDTTAVLRAVELRCDAVMKATQVDGVYSADPKTDPSAERFETITYDEVLQKGLGVMDAAAIALARDNAMPVSVFKLESDGAAIREAWHGRRPQTRVTA